MNGLVPEMCLGMRLLLTKQPEVRPIITQQLLLIIHIEANSCLAKGILYLVIHEPP